MYNYYDFAADFPRDKGTRKFLLSDYFHDSVIRSVELDSEKRILEISMQCCRDWENKGDGERSDPQYTYILRFFGVAGFVCETELIWPEYINGRFKNTAWLQTRQKETGRKIYQFRMGLADGYLDILFTRFQIRKALGRIYYGDVTEGEDTPFYKTWLIRNPEKLAAVRRDLTKAAEDDLSVDFHLEMLYANEAEDLAEWCRYVLRGNICDEGKAYAAWLLSKCGGKEDLKVIWERYCTELKNDFQTVGPALDMKRRNYQDAVEWLQSRERV